MSLHGESVEPKHTTATVLQEVARGRCDGIAHALGVCHIDVPVERGVEPRVTLPGCRLHAGYARLVLTVRPA